MGNPIQLGESIPVETALGSGQAVIFEAGEHDNYWTVILENCAVVTFAQSDIRASRSFCPRRGLSLPEMKGIIAMPSRSDKQAAFMRAAAHDKAFAKRADIPQSVAREFVRADQGRAAPSKPPPRLQGKRK